MTELPVIEKSVDVPLAPDAAFDLFTRNLANWWPVESHSLSAHDSKLPESVTVEAREGGQILEEKQDGSTEPWGRITAWEPGVRLAINWHVGRPESDATQLEVRFIPYGNGSRVFLTHGGWSALRTHATSVYNGYQTGWDHVLGQCFYLFCQAPITQAAE